MVAAQLVCLILQCLPIQCVAKAWSLQDLSLQDLQSLGFPVIVMLLIGSCGLISVCVFCIGCQAQEHMRQRVKDCRENEHMRVVTNASELELRNWRCDSCNKVNNSSVALFERCNECELNFCQKCVRKEMNSRLFAPSSKFIPGLPQTMSNVPPWHGFVPVARVGSGSFATPLSEPASEDGEESDDDAAAGETSARRAKFFFF